MTTPVPHHTGQELPAALENIPRGDLLLGYQQRSFGLLDSTALVVIEKSRRIGLTWGVASWAALKAATRKSDNGNDVLYISYAQEMTREFIDACAMWAKAYSLGLKGDPDEYFFEDQDEHGNTKAIKAFRIQFASGFEIVALSSAPRSIRGKQGAVIIDEAAFVDNLDELLKAALALIMWGGQVIVVSTHNGVENPFNQLIDVIKAGKRKGKVIRITFKDAMHEGLYERICLVTGKTPTPDGKIKFEKDIRDSYGEDADEELDCIPKSGAGCFIPPELVIAAQHPDAGKPELYQKGPCIGGRDIAAGRNGDLATMWIHELVGPMLWLRERREEKNLGLLEQEEIFDGQFKRFNIMAYGVDQTGMGEGEVARAKRKWGERVTGVIFSPATRLMLASAAKRRLENGLARLPDDAAIRADFRGVKKSKGAGNTVQIITEGSGKKGGDGSTHPDMFWAFALACWLADAEQPTCHGFIPVTKLPGKFDEPPGDGDRTFRMRADNTQAARRFFGKGTW